MNIRHSNTCAVKIVPLPAFQDNYIWLIEVGNHAVVVDPGDAAVVEQQLAERGLELHAILVTHHHADHIGGLAALVAGRDIPVFGPACEPIGGVTHPVGEGDEVFLPKLALRFTVLDVPGHTRTHIAYLAPGVLFPGDTLFSAGCGRLLGGTAEQLHDSLQRLAGLPEDTAVYCAHEYTLANLAFAQAAEPHNAARDDWIARCKSLRADGQSTLPSTIGDERRINPFLRTGQSAVIDAVAAHSGRTPAHALACFTALRAWKDVF
jgi:hydroxyacylglutathione hydrolase